MSTPPSGDPLADRYGLERSPSRRRVRLLVAVVAGVGALAWLVWAGLAAGRGVDSTLVGFRVLGEDRLEVTYDVAKDPQRTAVCTLQALDLSRGTVGVLRVAVGPQRSNVVRRVDTVRTSAPAAAGIVRDCELRP